MRKLNPLSMKIEKIPFTTVNHHWKHKKEQYITFNSISFLSDPPHTKEKNTIKSDIISFFILPKLLNCDKIYYFFVKGKICEIVVYFIVLYVTSYYIIFFIAFKNISPVAEILNLKMDLAIGHVLGVRVGFWKHRVATLCDYKIIK